MKRDWDAIRKILIATEAAGAEGQVSANQIDPNDGENVSYNMALLVKAGFAEGPIWEGNDGSVIANLNNLTWNGHELLDHIRQDKVWESVKKTALQKGIDLTFSIVTELAAKTMRSFLNSNA